MIPPDFNTEGRDAVAGGSRIPEHGTETLTPDDLQAYAIFRDIPRKQLERLFEWNDRAVVRRWVRPGEIVCRQGEYGSTAFYIVEGRVEVFIASPLGHAKSHKEKGQRKGLRGLVRTFATTLLAAREDPREEEVFRRSIPIDAPIFWPSMNRWANWQRATSLAR